MTNKARPVVETEALSRKYRASVVDRETGRLLITNFHGTEQERDLSEPSNCRGFGRIRHFRRGSGESWVPNPLPIDPACKALRLPHADLIRAQVFQLAACNWRCWYCFVPFDLLAANPKHAQWFTVSELIDLYLDQEGQPLVIDLTGGEPSLAPEWIPWMMRELRVRGLDRSTYLWSDDNLSSTYFWEVLSDDEIALVSSYRNYGRVCCFKGFDATSFAFNTRAAPSLFEKQFELMGNFVQLGIDVYAYATFTTPNPSGAVDNVPRFIDRLQALDENLPLRTVPLEVSVFSPVRRRLTPDTVAALKHQRTAVDVWKNELAKRFSSSDLRRSTADIALRSHRVA